MNSTGERTGLERGLGNMQLLYFSPVVSPSDRVCIFILPDQLKPSNWYRIATSSVRLCAAQRAISKFSIGLQLHNRCVMGPRGRILHSTARRVEAMEDADSIAGPAVALGWPTNLASSGIAFNDDADGTGGPTSRPWCIFDDRRPPALRGAKPGPNRGQTLARAFNHVDRLQPHPPKSCRGLSSATSPPQPHLCNPHYSYTCGTPFTPSAFLIFPGIMCEDTMCCVSSS